MLKTICVGLVLESCQEYQDSSVINRLLVVLSSHLLQQCSFLASEGPVFSVGLAFV